jgi:hypothetical protein
VAAKKIKVAGPMGRSVGEAVESLLPPPAARMVLDVALLLDGRDRVPEEADAARSFVRGPLKRALEVCASNDAAEAVVERLEPILEMASSHVRRRRVDDSQVVSTTPRPSSVERVVLVSSLDRTSVHGLARGLTGQASVKQVSNVFDLMSALEEHRLHRPAVVVDCSLPAIDPTVLATMLPHDIEGLLIILWGATERLVSDLEEIAPISRSFLVCAADANHDDLATLLRTL